MVKKKTPVKRRSTRRAAPRAAPRRHRSSSGTKYIPGAVATVAVVAVNKDNIANLYNAVTNNGSAKLADIPGRIVNNQRVPSALNKFVKMDNIVNSATAVAGGYVAGEIIKKYAPSVIKRPLGMLAKKMPRVI